MDEVYYLNNMDTASHILSRTTKDALLQSGFLESLEC